MEIVYNKFGSRTFRDTSLLRDQVVQTPTVTLVALFLLSPLWYPSLETVDFGGNKTNKNIWVYFRDG